ncbi:hypothetical protein TELCIR_10215, partial [Teladorsagia circumcincta]
MEKIPKDGDLAPIKNSSFSVFGIIGLALVLAAALTDNWTEYQVNRREVINAFNREPELNVRLKDAFVRNVNYFSRNYGLFQICFPDSVPSGLGVVVVCLAIAGIGCARQSRKAFMFAGVGLLLTVLLFAVSMACWHYVNYLERAVLEMSPFYKSWEPGPRREPSLRITWEIRAYLRETSIVLAFFQLHHHLDKGLFLIRAEMGGEIEGLEAINGWIEEELKKGGGRREERRWSHLRDGYATTTMKEREPILKSTTRFNFGWSLVVAWVGILFILFASVFFICSASRLK